jgi:hypothetical protein
VPARSSVVLSVRPDELPVQTVGASSVFTIVARHALPVPARLPAVFAPGAAASGRQVSAPPRRVTFDADYATVTLRTSAAQAEASAPRYDDDLGAAAAPVGRVFDLKRGALRDIAELVAEAKRPGMAPVAIMGEPVDLPREGGLVSAPAEVVP